MEAYMKKILKIVLFALALSYSHFALSVNCPVMLSDAAGSEFESTGTGILIDEQNKKMWMNCRLTSATEFDCKSEAASMSWYDLDEAMAQIKENGLFGYSDWRIPTVQELLTVVDRKCYVVEYSERRFDPEIPAANFWISKPYVLTSKIGYDVLNNHSYTMFGYYPYINRAVHLVRNK